MSDNSFGIRETNITIIINYLRFWSVSTFTVSNESSLDLFPDAGRLFMTFSACWDATSSNLEVSSFIDSSSVASFECRLPASDTPCIGTFGIDISDDIEDGKQKYMANHEKKKYNIFGCNVDG